MTLIIPTIAFNAHFTHTWINYHQAPSILIVGEYQSCQRLTSRMYVLLIEKWARHHQRRWHKDAVLQLFGFKQKIYFDNTSFNNPIFQQFCRILTRQIMAPFTLVLVSSVIILHPSTRHLYQSIIS